MKMPAYEIVQKGKWFVIMCEGHEMPPFTQFATAAEAEAEAERWRAEDDAAKQDARESFYEEQNKL